MKKFFHKLKELWKNPRGHALMEIGIYLLFFGILFLFLNIKSAPKVYNTVESKYENLDTYAYTMKIETENQIYQIKGNRQINEFLILEETGEIYQILEHQIVDSSGNMASAFDWNFFSPKQLSSFIKNGTVNATTNYKDGSKKVEYEMECNLWNSDVTGICQLETIQKEEEIVQVTLAVQDLYQVEIHYTHETVVE